MEACRSRKSPSVWLLDQHGISVADVLVVTARHSREQESWPACAYSARGRHRPWVG